MPLWTAQAHQAGEKSTERPLRSTRNRIESKGCSVLYCTTMKRKSYRSTSLLSLHKQAHWSHGRAFCIWTKALPVHVCRGVISHSDGPDAGGRIFMYLTPMDETVQELQVSSMKGSVVFGCCFISACAAMSAQHDPCASGCGDVHVYIAMTNACPSWGTAHVGKPYCGE